MTYRSYMTTYSPNFGSDPTDKLYWMTSYEKDDRHEQDVLSQLYLKTEAVPTMCR